MGAKKGAAGTSLGGRIEMSPERKKRRGRARRHEEERWAAEAGPVTVRIRDTNPNTEQQ